MRWFLAMSMVLILAVPSQVHAWGQSHYGYGGHHHYHSLGHGGYFGNGPVVVPRGHRPYGVYRAPRLYYGWAVGGSGW
jgi:hypothetical protein